MFQSDLMIIRLTQRSILSVSMDSLRVGRYVLLNGRTSTRIKNNAFEQTIVESQTAALSMKNVNHYYKRVNQLNDH